MTEGKPRRGVAVALGLVCFLAYNANGREIASYDSQGTKLLAVEIVKRHTLALGHVVGRVPALAERPAFVEDLHGNFRSAYPLPSAFAGAVVAWLLSVTRFVDLDAPLAAALVAKLTASALCGLTVALAYGAAARRSSGGAAALVALAFGLGTNIWAGVSQTLWQQETALCALMAAVVLLASPRASLGRAVAVGALLGLTGWARPQLAPAVAVLALSMIVRWGRSSLVGWIPLAATAALAIGINVSWFGHVLGAAPIRESMHATVHGVRSAIAVRPWISAAGLLVSPSRGLLIFSPVVLCAAAGLGALRREGSRSDLTWCGAAAALTFALYVSYAVWWGGHTYGPRYLLDMLPPLVPVAAAGMPMIARRRAIAAIAVAALIWSIVVAGAGAFVYPAEEWNSNPVDVDGHHERLWQWRDSQIVRVFTSSSSPQNFAFIEPGALRTQRP